MQQVKDATSPGIDWMHDQSIVRIAIELVRANNDEVLEPSLYHEPANQDAACIAQQMWAAREGLAPL